MLILKDSVVINLVVLNIALLFDISISIPVVSMKVSVFNFVFK